MDRLLAMTVLLLNRGRLSAKELADRFEVSTKTIYRDMDTLSQAGIPIVAHQGTAGGFEMMEEFTISRQFLTLEEIQAIVAAVKGINSAMDDNKLDHLLEKVNAVLRKSDKLQSASQGEKYIFDFNPWGQGPDMRDKLNRLKQAIEEKRLLDFRYMNMNGNESERQAEPTALILKGNVWYLQAYCMLRGEFRIFRLSRIRDLTVSDIRFERREVPALDGYAWDETWNQVQEKWIMLNFSREVRYRVEDMFNADQVSVLSDGAVRVEGLFSDDEWFYGMLLSFGHYVKVEQPASVAEEIIRRAQRIMDRYTN
jgi:predicted DNA-binding transcriptional regulator YafY